MTVSFSPLLSLPLLALLASLGVALWLLAVRRRARGAWLRLIPLATLLAALVNPTLVTEERQPIPDTAVIVVDDTLSQAIGDRKAQAEAALTALRDKLGRFPGLEVRVERVASGAADTGTRLFEALNGVLTDTPRQRLAGVVMITDGLVHDVPADLGKSLGAPVHVLLTGHSGESDRRLVLLDSPQFALVGHTASLRFKVEEAEAQGAVGVEVRVDGQPFLSTVVPLNREATLEVPIRHAGQTVVELAAAEGSHELSLTNNRAAVGISGVRDRLKVLLISGEPHPGERTWRNLLKADPAVDLVHFTILRPPDKDDRTPIRELALITFPVRELFEEKLPEFDLVIFDRYRRRQVLGANYFMALADYVEAGGALLAAVGPEIEEPGAGLWDTPLARVLPAQGTGGMLTLPFRPTITDAGRRHPVTSGLIEGSPRWGRWLRQAVVSESRGTTLLSGLDGRPLVVLDKVGRGRIAEVLSDTIWLWARGWDGGGPHDELLRRLAHWLMQEPDLEEEALTAEIRSDRLEVTRRSLGPPPTAATVTRPDGTAVEMGLTDQGDGRATGSLSVDQPGLWRVEEQGLTAIAAAGSLAPVELAELAATSRHLAPVATTTGGSVHWLAEGGVPDLRRVSPGRQAAGKGWIGLPARGDYAVTGLREVPLLPGVIILLLGFGGLLLAWQREGR